MKRIAVALDEETAKWAQDLAISRNKSVSALLREVLAECMRRDLDYDAAKKRTRSLAAIWIKKP